MTMTDRSQAEPITHVSSGGGSAPAWSRTGRELFYLAGDGAALQMTVVAVPDLPSGAPFDFGDPKILFPYSGANRNGRTYDVSPDGQRFVVAVPGGDDGTRPAINIITDWFTDVRKVR